MKKYYCLYSDKNQTKLLACAESKEQLLEESQYYKEGQWFEYDIDPNNEKKIENEKLYKFNKFPKEPKNRPFHIPEDKHYKWVQ